MAVFYLQLPERHNREWLGGCHYRKGCLKGCAENTALLPVDSHCDRKFLSAVHELCHSLSEIGQPNGAQSLQEKLCGIRAKRKDLKTT